MRNKHSREFFCGWTLDLQIRIPPIAMRFRCVGHRSARASEWGALIACGHVDSTHDGQALIGHQNFPVVSIIDRPMTMGRKRIRWIERQHSDTGGTPFPEQLRPSFSGSDALV